MLLILLVVIAGGASLAMQINGYLKFQKAVKEFENVRKKKVQHTPVPIVSLVMMCALALLCFGLAVYIAFNPSSVPQDEWQLYCVFSVMLGLMFLANIIFGKRAQCLYYTEEGFFHDEKLVRFRSIRDMKMKKGLKRVMEIQLYNGEKVEVTQRHADLITELREACRKEK